MTDPPKERYLPGPLSESLQRQKARGFCLFTHLSRPLSGIEAVGKGDWEILAFGALLTLSLCLGVETSSRRPATSKRLALTIDLLDLKALFHPRLFSKSCVPGTFSGQDALEGTGTPRNEPLPNRLSLGASIIHVLARSSPARNRSRRFSVTYICAGKGSPGLGGWVGVVARVGRRTPQPSTPSGSRPLPIRSSVGQRFSPRASPVSARRSLCGRLKSQAGGRSGPPRQPSVRGRQRRLGFPVPVEAVAPAGRPFAPERRDGNFCWVSFPPPTPVLEETVLRGASFGRRNIMRAPVGLWVLAEAGKDPTDHSFCPWLPLQAGERGVRRGRKPAAGLLRLGAARRGEPRLRAARCLRALLPGGGKVPPRSRALGGRKGQGWPIE